LADLQHEVPLTEAEREIIYSHSDPDVLLVEGQALAFWASRFQIKLPTELQDEVTTDADFIGSVKNAASLNSYLHWNIWRPEMGDTTSQTAKLTKIVERNGVKQIDFLHSIIGIRSEDANKRAVKVKLSVKGGALKILHPLDVLTSRLSNLKHLREKQNAVGVAQARLAISVVAAYLESLLVPDQRRQLLNSIEHLTAISLDKALGSTLDKYDLDPLQAVPTDNIDIADFKTSRWPQILQQAEQQRASRALVRDRMTHAKKE
jgi:hypothetical protein